MKAEQKQDKTNSDDILVGYPNSATRHAATLLEPLRAEIARMAGLQQGAPFQLFAVAVPQTQPDASANARSDGRTPFSSVMDSELLSRVQARARRRDITLIDAWAEMAEGWLKA